MIFPSPQAAFTGLKIRFSALIPKENFLPLLKNNTLNTLHCPFRVRAGPHIFFISLVLFLCASHWRRNYILSYSLLLAQAGQSPGYQQARDLVLKHQSTITESKRGSWGPSDTFTACVSSALQLTHMKSHHALSRIEEITVYYLFKKPPNP